MMQQDPVQQALEAYRDACVAYCEMFPEQNAYSGRQRVAETRAVYLRAREAAARSSDQNEILRVICDAACNAGGHVYNVEGMAILEALRAAGFEVRRATKP